MLKSSKLFAGWALYLLLTAAASGQAQLQVVWKAGRLTLTAENAPLSQILEELQRQTGLEVRGADQLRGRVSIHLSNVALSDGLQALLQGCNYAIIGHLPLAEGAPRPSLYVFGYVANRHNDVSNGVAESTGRSRAAKKQTELGENRGQFVLVDGRVELFDEQALRKGIRDDDPDVQGRAVETLAQQNQGAALEELLAQTHSDQAASRLQALQILDQTRWVDGATVLSALEKALGDEDPSVKGLAIESLAMRGGSVAMDYLSKALNDPDPSVRAMVVESVAQTDEGLPLLQQAASDSDESVSTSAAALLKQALSRSQ